ncbi:unnamed protein product, partial [marine sediment metagenome]
PPESLPQTPVAAAALVVSYYWPAGGSIHVIDENKALVLRRSGGWEVIRENDCVYRVEGRRGTQRSSRLSIDFSKLVSYQTQGRKKMRLLGDSGLWCSYFNGYKQGTCFDAVPLQVRRVADISRILRAIQFIQGFCSSQGPF